MPPIFYVCGDTAFNPARSGIQTVVRSLAAAFGTLRAPVRPVVWQPAAADLRPLPAQLSLGLEAEILRDPSPGFFHPPRFSDWPWILLAGGRAQHLPLHRHPLHRRAPQGTWVLVPELLYVNPRADELIAYVHRQGWRCAVILHDTIPVQHPEFVPAGLPEAHAAYLRGLTRADLILPNSHATETDWHAFVAREQLRCPPVRTCGLACDLPGVPRVRHLPAPPSPPPALFDTCSDALSDSLFDACSAAPSSAAPPDDASPDAAPSGAPAAPVRLLCVSTLEPRKNHRTLLQAFELASARQPRLPLQLDLVGSPYVGSPELADLVRAACARLPGLRWHPRVEHAALARFYAQCHFSVYPSLLEGFGLPVIESLWFGRPCLCANFGVMAENARGGGCLTCDVRDPHALADALLRLARDAPLRARLAREATARPLKTWTTYAQEILRSLASHPS